ncbi:MAG: hypothetical protein IT305_25780 [Chloroflexi bacterium]|nr:hypothetical protein [Chloroflexota bacterium]
MGRPRENDRPEKVQSSQRPRSTRRAIFGQMAGRELGGVRTAPPSSSRRDFLRHAVAVAATTLVAPMLAATASACSRLPSPRPSLTVALGADPAGLNPLLQTGLVEASVHTNIYDSLAFLDAEGAPQAALAESWRVLDDRTWEFRLRPNVTFHNGEPFDSSAVRFTVETMLDPASKSPVKAQLDSIDRVETPTPLVVRIVTKKPFAPLLAELTALAMLPPRHAAASGMDALSERPVGTGPFRFVEWAHDDRLVLDANRQHWRGAPGVDRVEFRPIPDAATRLAALRTAQVDLSTSISVDQVSELASAELRLFRRPGIQTLYLRLHARRPPLDDVRVRRAVAHAIDVDTIVEKLYGGYARRVTAPFPSNVFGYDPSVAPVPYDPARARALLTEAGYGDGVQVSLETPRGRYPMDDQLALVVAGSLRGVGIEVEQSTLEWGAYLKKINAGQGQDVFLLAGTNRTFDPHFTMARIYANASSFGRDYYGNPDIDPLVSDAAATLDADRRRALYQQLLGTLRTDVPAVWLAQLDDLYGARPSLEWQPRADSLTWLWGAKLTG